MKQYLTVTIKFENSTIVYDKNIVDCHICTEFPGPNVPWVSMKYFNETHKRYEFENVYRRPENVTVNSYIQG